MLMTQGSGLCLAGGLTYKNTTEKNVFLKTVSVKRTEWKNKISLNWHAEKIDAYT